MERVDKVLVQHTREPWVRRLKVFIANKWKRQDFLLLTILKICSKKRVTGDVMKRAMSYTKNYQSKLALE